MARDIIVGSGPAGAAAAAALTERGRNVIMLDVGETIESENARVRERMSQQDPDEWATSDIEFMNARTQLNSGGGLIHPYGSDYPYRDRIQLFGPKGHPTWLDLRPSFGRGGLSNGWGAAVLPYRAEDIADWPITEAELTPHYAAVERLVPIASEDDDLAHVFPLHGGPSDHSVSLSSQAVELARRFDDRRDDLTSANVFAGKSRVAIDAGCRRCAMCHYGCPYGLIFNSANIVERLKRQDGFDYHPGHYVTRFAEQADGVQVWARQMDSGQIVDFKADRLFVAAGVLPTASLVLNSLNAFDQSITLNDSQHLFLPMLHSWAPRPDPVKEARHTLAQLFMEIIDKDICPNTVHAQLYTYNDLYPLDMRRRFGPAANMMKPLINALSRRLIVGQFFLHSDFSPSMEIRLNRQGETPQLAMKAQFNANTDDMIKAVIKKVSPLVRSLGLWPLSLLLRRGSVGSSFHCGGTFPMHETPRDLQSDRLGRPAGLQRVHIVDASVFPSIPATTITYSVMANAHRIASMASEANK